MSYNNGGGKQQYQPIRSSDRSQQDGPKPPADVVARIREACARFPNLGPGGVHEQLERAGAAVSFEIVQRVMNDLKSRRRE